MHRIDEPNNVGNQFVLPAPGQPATRLGADWPNAVQEEICAVIEGAGIALAKGSHNQLRTAIANMINDLGTLVESDLADLQAAAALKSQFEVHGDATSGYRVYPDGWIEQWKRGSTNSTGTETSQTINFPIAFPAACYGCDLTTEITSGSSTSDIVYQRIGTPTTTGVTVQRQVAGGGDSVSTTPVIFAWGK